MNEYRARSAWAIALLVVVLTVAVGLIAYNVGLSHGVAGATVAEGITAAPPTPQPYANGWHRPWGLGFLFPLFFFLFWTFLFWPFWWRAGWHAGGPRYYESRFDEMHRRAHDRMAAKE